MSKPRGGGANSIATLEDSLSALSSELHRASTLLRQFDDREGRPLREKRDDEQTLFKLLDDVMRSYKAIDGMAECVHDVRVPREVLERLGDAAGATNPGIVTAACLDACAAERDVAERAKSGFEELRKALAAHAARAAGAAGGSATGVPPVSGGAAGDAAPAGDGGPASGKPPAKRARRTGPGPDR